MSLKKDPKDGESDLLSDWFAGWSNSSMTDNINIDDDSKEKYWKVLEHPASKIEHLLVVWS